jgi:hypothetical protein
MTVSRHPHDVTPVSGQTIASPKHYGTRYSALIFDELIRL